MQGRGSGSLAVGFCHSPHVQVEAGRLRVFKLPARHQRDAVTRAASKGLAASRQDSWGLQGRPQTAPHSLGKWWETPKGGIFTALLFFTSLDLLHGSGKKPGKPQWASTRQSSSSQSGRVVNPPIHPREPWAPPPAPRGAKLRHGGLQDKCLVPHWAEGLAYDLCAMDLVFWDEVFDHSLHPLLVVMVGRFLALGLDAQQAVRVAEPCEGEACESPSGAAAVPFPMGHSPVSTYH